jgi:hypothetical protein
MRTPLSFLLLALAGRLVAASADIDVGLPEMGPEGISPTAQGIPLSEAAKTALPDPAAGYELSAYRLTPFKDRILALNFAAGAGLLNDQGGSVQGSPQVWNNRYGGYDGYFSLWGQGSDVSEALESVTDASLSIRGYGNSSNGHNAYAYPGNYYSTDGENSRDFQSAQAAWNTVDTYYRKGYWIQSSAGLTAQFSRDASRYEYRYQYFDDSGTLLFSGEYGSSNQTMTGQASLRGGFGLGRGRFVDDAWAWKALQLLRELRQDGRLLRASAPEDVQALAGLLAVQGQTHYWDWRDRVKQDAREIMGLLSERGLADPSDWEIALLVIDSRFYYMSWRPSGTRAGISVDGLADAAFSSSKVEPSNPYFGGPNDDLSLGLPWLQAEAVLEQQEPLSLNWQGGWSLGAGASSDRPGYGRVLNTLISDDRHLRAGLSLGYQPSTRLVLNWNANGSLYQWHQVDGLSYYGYYGPSSDYSHDEKGAAADSQLWMVYALSNSLQGYLGAFAQWLWRDPSSLGTIPAYGSPSEQRVVAELLSNNAGTFSLSFFGGLSFRLF